MPQRLVSHDMAILIVDVLEVIDVDHRHIKLGLLTLHHFLRPHKLVFDTLAKRQGGQRIVAHGPGQEPGLEPGHQTDPFGRALLEHFQFIRGPRLP